MTADIQQYTRPPMNESTRQACVDSVQQSIDDQYPNTPPAHIAYAKQVARLIIDKRGSMHNALWAAQFVINLQQCVIDGPGGDGLRKIIDDPTELLFCVCNHVLCTQRQYVLPGGMESAMLRARMAIMGGADIATALFHARGSE